MKTKNLQKNRIFKINLISKVFFTLLILTLSTSVLCIAQDKLEAVYVEKVPVTPAALAADPTLPAGAIAYRVFVDMAPDYQVQAVFSLASHEMKIGTSTSFYNNEDGVAFGRAMANGVFNNAAGRFDSYITIDGVTSTRIGLRTDEDITDGIQDGYTTGTSLALTTVGADFEIPFGVASFSGTFSTFSGIWSVTGGETGTTASNHVLIGQFTTNGVFNFELNVQIRRNDGTGVQQYVAKNPASQGGLYPEYYHKDLTYNSLTVGISDPLPLNSSIRVYPVPVKDKVTVELNSPGQHQNISISVYDICGKVCLIKNMKMIDNQYTEVVDMSLLQNGIYFIKVTDGDGFEVCKKLVKN